MLRYFTYKDIIYYMNTELGFGKHQGLTIEDVIEEDVKYIEWMISEGFEMDDDVYIKMADEKDDITIMLFNR